MISSDLTLTLTLTLTAENFKDCKTKFPWTMNGGWTEVNEMGFRYMYQIISEMCG